MQGGTHGSQQFGFRDGEREVMGNGLDPRLDELLLGSRLEFVKFAKRDIQLLLPTVRYPERRTIPRQQMMHPGFVGTTRGGFIVVAMPGQDAEDHAQRAARHFQRH